MGYTDIYLLMEPQGLEATAQGREPPSSQICLWVLQNTTEFELLGILLGVPRASCPSSCLCAVGQFLSPEDFELRKANWGAESQGKGLILSSQLNRAFGRNLTFALSSESYL